MNIEKNSEGAYFISDIVGGYLVTKRYYGFTKREALQLFKEEASYSEWKDAFHEKHGGTRIPEALTQTVLSPSLFKEETR